MATILNLARVRTTTTGAGTMTLGGAIEGFKTFAQAGAVNGGVYAYAIRDGQHSEIGYGTYTTASATLTRNVRSSTNSNNAIVLTGNAEVFSSPSSAEFIESGAATDLDDQIVLKAAVFN